MTDPEETLAEHLSAIADRDLTRYAATLHDQVTLILPNGTRHEGRDSVIDFHRDFFADTDWTQDFHRLRLVTTPTTMAVTHRADYSDVDQAGEPVRMAFLVALVFVQDGARWLLLHDQCTPLPTTG